jgi:glycerophosphoryl diester phosphodiesterase
VFVVAHRSRGFGGPENSREAVRNALAAGHLMIEIDLRYTSDGEVVVFHDRRLDFRTSGQGKISSLTLDQLRLVHLANGETVPRFREIYELTRGRAVLWLHFKSDVVAEVAQWMDTYGSLDDVIFYLDHWDLVNAAAPLKRSHPAMLVMTRAHKRGDLKQARTRLGQWPDLVHIDADASDDMSWFKRHGVKVAIKSLHLEQLWPHERGQRRVQALTSGAQLILVDEPLFFLAGSVKED